MSFQPNYPWAIVYPAHPTNLYPWQTHNGGVKATHKAMVLHTPEETADGYPGTPAWFATYKVNPNQRGSTYYFVSYQLDQRRPGFTNIYQCVHEDDGAIANGLNGKPRPSWASAGSLNFQTDNIEIEGRAASIHQTLNVGEIGKAQWRSLLDLVTWCARTHGYPMDREHIIGHYQVSVDRSDPGSQFPWDELISDLNGKDDAMIPFNGLSAWYADPNHQWISQATAGVNATIDFQIPPSAVAVEVEVYLHDDSSYVDVKCDDEGVTPELQAFRVPEKALYGHGRVQLSAPDARGHRWFHLHHIGFVPAHIAAVGIVGYYNS